MNSMCITPTYTPVLAGALPAALLAASAKALPVCSSRKRDWGSITVASFPDSLRSIPSRPPHCLKPISIRSDTDATPVRSDPSSIPFTALVVEGNSERGKENSLLDWS